MRIEKTPSTVFTPLADGTAVLLSLDTLFYYSLNRTGAAVWQQLEEKKVVTLEDLVGTTCELFEVDHPEANRSLQLFVEKLIELKMVRVS